MERLWFDSITCEDGQQHNLSLQTSFHYNTLATAHAYSVLYVAIGTSHSVTSRLSSLLAQFVTFELPLTKLGLVILVKYVM